MTFIKFALRMVPVKTICEHCHTRLKGDLLLRAAYYGALVFGVLFGLRVVNLREQLGWDMLTMLIAAVIFIIGIIIIVGGFAWVFAGYQRDN